MNGNHFRMMIAAAVILWGIALLRRFRRLPPGGVALPRFRRLADVGVGLIGAGVCSLAVCVFQGRISEDTEKFFAYLGLAMLTAAPLALNWLLDRGPLLVGLIVFAATLSLLMGIPIRWS